MSLVDYEKRGASGMAESIIKNGMAKQNLKKLLLAHRVPQKIVSDIFKNSFAEVIGLKKVDMDIKADNNFILKGINQRNVGNFVNFELGAARYEFGVKEKSLNGILLYHRPNDLIKKGEPLFSIYSTNPIEVIQKKENIIALLKESILKETPHR